MTRTQLTDIIITIFILFLFTPISNAAQGICLHTSYKKHYYIQLKCDEC